VIFLQPLLLKLLVEPENALCLNQILCKLETYMIHHMLINLEKLLLLKEFMKKLNVLDLVISLIPHLSHLKLLILKINKSSKQLEKLFWSMELDSPEIMLNFGLNMSIMENKFIKWMLLVKLILKLPWLCQIYQLLLMELVYLPPKSILLILDLLKLVTYNLHHKLALIQSPLN
jgi:hypothetical protein